MECWSLKSKNNGPADLATLDDCLPAFHLISLLDSHTSGIRIGFLCSSSDNNTCSFLKNHHTRGPSVEHHHTRGLTGKHHYTRGLSGEHHPTREPSVEEHPIRTPSVKHHCVRDEYVYSESVFLPGQSPKVFLYCWGIHI